MIATKWGLEYAEPVRRDFEAEYEPPACRSLLYTDNGTEPGPRRCAVTHAETGEVEHGSLVGTAWTSWTDAMAARSLADFGPRPAVECTECPRPTRAAGLCGPCFTARERDDNRDAESEAVT